MSDLRIALRQLSRRPGFSATVILMLAIGIGATTAIYTLFHEVLVRPLRVDEPERLVNLAAPGPKWGGTSCNDAGSCDEIFSYPMFRDLQARQAAFAGIAAHRQFDADFVYDEHRLAGSGLLVSGSYFSVLNLRPALGRLLGAQDDVEVGQSSVAVLSHEYWRSVFASDPAVSGRTIVVNGRALTIVGVAPEGFTGTTPGNRPQVFVPITMRWAMEPTRARDDENRRSYWVYLFARLKPGNSLEQADAAINALYSSILNEVEAPLQTDVSAEQLDRFRRKRITLAAGTHGQSAIADAAATPLTLLLGVTALVLLIVCVNIANLLLLRGAARAGEMAIRASLGAGPSRLGAQLVVEVSLLALAGGLASLPVAHAVFAALTGLLPASLAGGFAVDLGPAAALVAGAAALVTLIAFGVVPALHAARTDAGTVIKSQALRSVSTRGAARLRNVLATVQIAFSAMLLVLAGLFAKSLGNVQSVELGLDTEALVTFTLSPRRSGYAVEQATQTFDRIEQELASQPGVTSVASSRILLLDGRRWSAGPLTIDGIEREPVTDTIVNAVGPGFFRTLSIPLLRGRDFTAADTASTVQVAIVNESFVRRAGLGADALGKRIRVGRNTFEIVGVTADTAQTNVKDDIVPQFFLSRHQFTNLDAASFYVRGTIDEAALLELAPRAVAAVDPNLAVGRLATVRALVDDNVYLDRLVTLLATAFALLATLLAAIGLYGVISYNIRQRTREIGLRLALGAEPARLRTMVLRQVGVIALLGLPIGLTGALLVGRAAQALLFGLTAYDPTVLVGAVAILGAVVLAAGVVPARRAARVPPMEALRHD
jgi:predicted permease